MQRDAIPQRYGALVLIFSGATSKTRILDALHAYTDDETYENSIEIVYREIKNFHGWEMADLLTTLFESYNSDAVKAAQEQWGRRSCWIFPSNILTDIPPLFSAENTCI